ncbi:methylmalonyl-CoA mutase [Anseongella ginsenosidimutans]|uniref:Methylmalonyl-CoA mutase n=1 Tax=Anseongella ginsenosidimutans TaxID=496056 RepID=A0A4R3KLV0_9SPHI|nr:methylmalonyl-CoA mutase family protein [Anseongella ginsenosidimutans]QEC54070.1 methylmalonyl-CoA mutase [Anseongella ginsenosidimutans]TCS85164.1 methylmalonyl-CoA mutase [Anseongella ginsenosidimutans]
MAKKVLTTSGIEIKDVYTSCRPMEELPGVFPYTRGIRPDMYRGKHWTMRQYAGFSTAEASNKRYHYLLKQGITGLSVAFDLPTQIGYDSDHPLAEGEVGKVGVAIDSLEDMEVLFNGIELQKISTSMTINATASVLLAMYIALARKQGADPARLSGTIQNDILKEYAARGTYIYPPKPSMRLITDIFEYCSRELPRWNTISISGYHIREAGSTAAQELAFTLANGKAYLEAAIEKGLDINVFGRQLSFFFNCHNNFFEEIAKFRAARRMWARITSGMGATDVKAQQLRFHAQTAGSALTAQQPRNNISRVTLQALAAVLGGTQSLHTNGYDEALSLPTEEAARIALRTQQIIAYESGAADTVDPLAGSYFIESLTDELEQAAWSYIRKIDELGGAVKATETGYIQQQIGEAAYRYQKTLEEGEQVIVGVNRFVMEEGPLPASFQVDDSIRQVQAEKLQRLKAGRDGQVAAQSLENLRLAAAGTENLMPFILQCVETSCTLGEIAGELRSVFGEYGS